MFQFDLKQQISNEAAPIFRLTNWACLPSRAQIVLTGQTCKKHKNWHNYIFVLKNDKNGQIQISDKTLKYVS